MRKRNSLVLLLALHCLSALAQTSENIPADKLASASGSVTNSISGEPVLRARVLLQVAGNGSLPAYAAVTNAEGKFLVTQVPPGEYVVVTEKPGFHAPVTPRLRVDSGQNKEGLRLVMVPDGVIAGRVIDADGEPVEGAFVSIPDGGGGTTDDRGRYRIGGVQPGHYKLSASLQTPPRDAPEVRTDGSEESYYATTFYPSVLDERSAGRIVVSAGMETSELEIRLIRMPVLRISGIVTGLPEGKSDRQWYVDVTTRSHRHNGAPVRKDGRFDAWRVDPGHYWLTALGSQGGAQLRTAAVEVTVTGSNVEGVELHVVPPFDVTGAVRYEDDAARPEQSKPATGALATSAQRNPVLLIFQEIASQQQYARSIQASIQPDGTFALRQLQPGRYRVRPSWGHGYVKTMQLGSRQMDGQVVDLSNGTTGEALSVVVSSGIAAISGVVRKGGDPAASEKIALAHVPPDGSLPTFAWSAADGSYKFEGLAPGTYKVVAMDREEPFNMSYQQDADDLPEGVEIRLMPGDKATRDLKALSPDVQ